MSFSNRVATLFTEMHALEQTLERAKIWLEIEKRDRRGGNGNMEKRMWTEIA